MHTSRNEYWLKTLHKYIGFLSFLPLIGLISMVSVVSLKTGELPTRSTNSIQFFINSAYDLEDGLWAEGLFLDTCKVLFERGTVFLPAIIIWSFISSVNFWVTKRQDLVSNEGLWFPIVSLAVIAMLMATDYFGANLWGWYVE